MWRKQTLALARTGDVDSSVQVADPETQPPRLVSEAQGLHGRYHDTLNYADGYSLAQDEVVRTECLRTGDRCISLTYGADGVAALVFANGKWTKGLENKSPCEAGGTALEKYTANYALPLPPQDPITVLTGRGHLEVIGTACAVGVDFDEKFERTGDYAKALYSSAASSSAIWMVFSAAPLRRLSFETNSASPRPSGTPGS